MAKKNDDFFVTKKEWSKVKDELLGCYLTPYFSKIFNTKRPVVYVDCFSGKGKFDDGSDGSPIIALKIIEEAKRKAQISIPFIKTYFIDLNYADDLRINLNSFNNVNIISGKYECEIDNILNDKHTCNVFLYIDPYGIKALDCSKFDYFASHFKSVELLINLNSFGFIREACHALGANFDDPEIFGDLIEYDSSKFDASEESIISMNQIAGGDYWQSIIMDYKSNKITGYEAEERFAKEYCKRLSQSFKYVLNMPLRIKEGQRPKYRMIHATNNQDGCVLMADNICKRWEAMREIQTCGQISLFEQTVNNEYIDDKSLSDLVETHFKKYKTDISLTKALAEFFTANGAICPSKDICKKLSNYEKEGIIQISRTPSITKKGKPSTFMSEKTNKQVVLLRWK